MTREKLIDIIKNEYGGIGEYPWKAYPDYMVFRHEGNNKWYAIIMNVPNVKIGIEKEESIDIVNFKCEQSLIPSLLDKPGVHKAYHMNKDHWVSMELTDTFPDETILLGLDMSFNLTLPKKK